MLTKVETDGWKNLMTFCISTRPATHAVHTLSYYSKKYNLEPKDFFIVGLQAFVAYPFLFLMALKKQKSIM